MEIWSGPLENLPASGVLRGPSAVALGTFDGVHLGHQKLIRAMVDSARRANLQAVVFTFDRHPLQVLRPQSAPPSLTDNEGRARQIAQTGADLLLVCPFTPEFAALPPEAFVQKILGEMLQARQVWVGFNFTFGRGGAGTAAQLLHLAAPLGMEVHVLPAVRVGGQVVSSSLIRKLLLAGRVAEAARLLGRPYCLSGKVVRGEGRGRQLGFPTANLQIDPGLLWPADGVYAARAGLAGAAEEYGALVSIGDKPTFGGRQRVLEAYLIDWQGSLYGSELRVEFLEWLRPQIRFPGAAALRAQMEEDLAKVRGLFQEVRFTQAVTYDTIKQDRDSISSP
ncbi:MAG: bifunctional riboflavin kinase/FAD synthetase [Firmicutes bacterium]|nr:bifunctional riboflavin kinase/FAD synthetase [Bacillota bacterium]